VRNGQVPSLKLNANLMKLAHFNDLGPAKNDPSAFNLITTDLELATGRLSRCQRRVVVVAQPESVEIATELGIGVNLVRTTICGIWRIPVKVSVPGRYRTKGANP
jgi:hypothetical protein